MSNSIKMDSLFLKNGSIQPNTPVNYGKETNMKLSGGEEEKDGNAADTILNISKEARLKLKNRAQSEGAVKKAGVTSAREQFEIDALDTRDYMRGMASASSVGYPSGALLREWMRIDEPESYAKVEEIINKAAESEDKEEKAGCFSKVNTVEYDWFRRKCLDEDGWLKNPVTGKRLMISTLEERYSDAVHDTSIDTYYDDLSNEDASIWRFSTKFNILMPLEMLNELEMLNHLDQLSDKEQDRLREKVEKMDTAVNHMKEAEKNYEGALKYLRFGIKFDHAGNVTYHANYTGCEDENGIAADSAEELLEKLMSKS